MLDRPAVPQSCTVAFALALALFESALISHFYRHLPMTDPILFQVWYAATLIVAHTVVIGLPAIAWRRVFSGMETPTGYGPGYLAPPGSCWLLMLRAGHLGSYGYGRPTAPDST